MAAVQRDRHRLVGLGDGGAVVGLARVVGVGHRRLAVEGDDHGRAVGAGAGPRPRQRRADVLRRHRGAGRDVVALAGDDAGGVAPGPSDGHPGHDRHHHDRDRHHHEHGAPTRRGRRCGRGRGGSRWRVPCTGLVVVEGHQLIHLPRAVRRLVAPAWPSANRSGIHRGGRRSSRSFGPRRETPVGPARHNGRPWTTSSRPDLEPPLDAPAPGGDPTGTADSADDHTGNRRAFLGLLGRRGGRGGRRCGGLARLRAGSDPGGRGAHDQQSSDPPQLRVTTSTLPPLPIPDPLPANANAATPRSSSAPSPCRSIGVTADIQEGVTLTAINRGPGHWPNTAMPGALGNVVIAGHRTTYSKPFNRLNDLQPGDQVTMTTAEGRFVYQVRGVVIVPGEAVDIATQTYAHTATLFACHPPGSARQRIVAKLRLLDGSGRPVDSDAALPPLDEGSQETGHSLVVRSGTDPLADTGT